MTLLELLVKELPKHGGWPDSVFYVTQDSDGQVNGYGISVPTLHRETWAHQGFIGYLFDDKEMGLCQDWHTAIITRDHYEAALAASQQPVWGGEGLPPAGCECEFKYNNEEWRQGIIRYSSKYTILIDEGEDDFEDAESAFSPRDLKFRPIRTEEARKREDFIRAVSNHQNKIFGGLDTQFGELYDAIAAGGIPGGKLGS